MSKTLSRLPQNLWESPPLRRRLDQEAAFESSQGYAPVPQYYAAVPHTDSPSGSIELRNYDPEDARTPDPHELQIDFAQMYRQNLQRELHHDGVWIVGWTHPPRIQSKILMPDAVDDNCFGRLIAIWLDADGDPQFTYETESEFADIIQNGGHYYLEQAERAWQMWNEDYGKKALKSDFGLTEGEQRKEVLEGLGRTRH